MIETDQEKRHANARAIFDTPIEQRNVAYETLVAAAKAFEDSPNADTAWAALGAYYAYNGEIPSGNNDLWRSINLHVLADYERLRETFEKENAPCPSAPTP